MVVVVSFLFEDKSLSIKFWNYKGLGPQTHVWELDSGPPWIYNLVQNIQRIP